MTVLSKLTNNRVAKGVVGGALNVLPGYSTLGAQISDPNVNYQGRPNPQPTQIGMGDRDMFTFNPKNDVTEGPPGLLGVSTTAGGDADAQAARYDIENGLQSANSAYDRLNGQQDIGYGNIAKQYDSAYSRLMGDRDMARRDNQTTINNQLQEYQSARDQNNQNSRNLLMGARRLLGQSGAGGGSADLYGAPLAATQEANNANAQVKQVNERNIGALTTAYDDNERQYENSLGDLASQRDQGERSFKSGIENQRSQLLETIAQLTGQKRIAEGGNYQQAMDAAKPYTSRISGILNTIDGLAANPATIRAQQVNLARPDLAQYGLGRYEAPATARQDPTLGANARLLLGLDDRQREQMV